MLQMSDLYDSEIIPIEVEDRFRTRINNATATAMMLAKYAEQADCADPFEMSMVAMVADGISDILMTAIDEFENNAEREERNDCLNSKW